MGRTREREVEREREIGREIDRERERVREQRKNCDTERQRDTATGQQRHQINGAMGKPTDGKIDM